jgi:hypothetical protein
VENLVAQGSVTLGDEDALTEKTVTEMLARVTSEIKREENEKYIHEQQLHLETKVELISARSEQQRIRERLYWRCKTKAKLCAIGASLLIALLAAVGLCSGFGLSSRNRIASVFIILSTIAFAILTVANIYFGTTVANVYHWIEKRCLTWFLRREASSIGIDLAD